MFVATLAATAAGTSNYLSPVNELMYLVIIVALVMGIYMWKWSKTCRTKVRVLVVKGDGHGSYEFAPQEGGSVSLKNPSSGSIRVWPINELCAIDVPYPGDGLVPGFLQKTIRMVVVDEKDWEPLINRGPYKEWVASPDVIQALKVLAATYVDLEPDIMSIVDKLSPASTREMIASPAVLGNIVHEKVTETVLTVTERMTNQVESLMRRLGSMLNPTVVYIGLGVLAVMLVYVLVQVIPLAGKIKEMAAAVEAIKTGIGAK